MIITIEHHQLSYYENVYLFYVNNKKHYISKRLYDNLQQFYFRTPRSKRYEMIEQISGDRYTYDLSPEMWKTVSPNFTSFKEQVKKLIAEGYSTEIIKQKISRLT